MKTIAANQADSQIEPVVEDPSADTQTRWSTNDELLVWTVSRIEGGRRHGVERDCHVVYGLSRGFFVEQTRKFRASAEQCIEMLQQGKRAGTTQRKVALDSIIAIRSDEETGRLQIRTLNGTHQLEPISNEEADVLREIAAELVLRMPAGGASYADYSGPSFTERRRARDAEIEAAEAAELAEQERQALVALENARVEDAPDAYEAPTYDVPVEALEDALTSIDPATTESLPDSNVVSEVTDPADAAEAIEARVSTMDLQRIAAAVHAEMGPQSEVQSEVPAELPEDITVTGGVDITFEPVAEYVAEPIVEPSVAESLAPEFHYTSDAVASESLSGYDPDLDEVGPYVDPVAETLSHEAAAETAENFDRRQQRAMRRQIEGAVEPAPVADTASAETNRAPESSLFEGYGGPEAAPALSFQPGSLTADAHLPAEVVVQPVQQASEVAPAGDAQLGLPTATPAAVFAPSPHAETIYGEGSEDRRKVDDPNFPSVFDRRGAHPIVPVERPGWARFDDDDDDEEVAAVEAAEPEMAAAEAAAIPDGPPTLKAPSGGQPIGSGGAVGFNPDFDVNPFR